MLLVLQILWQATAGYPMGDSTGDAVGENTITVSSEEDTDIQEV